MQEKKSSFGERLGNVAYWLFFIPSVALVFMLGQVMGLCAASSCGASDWRFAFILAFLAAACFAIGWIVRYILAGVISVEAQVASSRIVLISILFGTIYGYNNITNKKDTIRESKVPCAKYDKPFSSRTTPEGLVREAENLRNECRGSSASEDKINDVCNKAAILEEQLERQGCRYVECWSGHEHNHYWVCL